MKHTYQAIWNNFPLTMAPSGGGGGNGGSHPGQGNGGGHGNGNGGGNGGGTPRGVLYGDQIIVLRDLDPTDGGGNGEPVLDDFNAIPQMIAVGFDPDGLIRPEDDDGYFPIYFDMVAEGDYEIPAAYLPYVQEVDLGRANVARAPERVAEKALLEAVTALTTADDVKTDPAGRLMYSTDGGLTYLTIDAPLENLALYQALMTGAEGWPEVQDGWGAIEVDGTTYDLSFLMTLDGFDPSALLGAAWAKDGEITLDALLYENTTLGINEVTFNGFNATVDYFEFTDGTVETYDYDRSDRYEDVWMRWIVIDPDTGQPEWEYGTILDAVFAGEDWGDAEDVYWTVDDNGTADLFDDNFVLADASASGVNDFAQAADDSRAVINFMHEYTAEVIDIADVPPEYLV